MSDCLNTNTFESAIKQNDLSMLKKLISERNINEKCIKDNGIDNDLFPLCLAIRMKNKIMIEELIKAGSNLRTKHYHKPQSGINYDCFRDILGLVCSLDDADLLELFLLNGSDPNHKINIKLNCGEVNILPLSYVAENGSPKLARVLIKYGAYVNEIIDCVYYGQRTYTTCLHIAMTMNQTCKYDMVNFLLENKADPNKIQNTFMGKTYPLKKAIDAEDIKLVCFLIKYGAAVEKISLDEILSNKSNHMRMVLQKRIAPELFQYYPNKTKNALKNVFICFRKKYKKIKQQIALYVITYMV
jgi:ankyrin repeat protein